MSWRKEEKRVAPTCSSVDVLFERSEVGGRRGGLTRKNFGYQAEKLQLSDPSPVPGVVCPPRSRSVDGPNSSPQGTSVFCAMLFVTDDVAEKAVDLLSSSVPRQPSPLLRPQPRVGAAIEDRGSAPVVR